jgi:long-chain acyl-CoA synthetase
MQYLCKFMLASMFFALTFSAQAIEIKGVKVDETAQVGGSALVLNGAGVRTKMVFKVYVAGLYLTQKTSDANAVISDTGNKRVSMHFLRELSAEKLLHGMNEGFTDNNSAVEMTAIEPQMKQFRAMMTSAKAVKENDVIVLDLTAAGTQVNINGKALGAVEGEAFNQALLRVWLGAKPVDALLKKAMLGQ